MKVYYNIWTTMYFEFIVIFVVQPTKMNITISTRNYLLMTYTYPNWIFAIFWGKKINKRRLILFNSEMLLFDHCEHG